MAAVGTTVVLEELDPFDANDRPDARGLMELLASNISRCSSTAGELLGDSGVAGESFSSSSACQKEPVDSTL